MNVCQFASGTLTTYLPMTIPDYFFWRHVIQFTNLILFVSQKHLDSSVPLDDDNLVIPGYNLVRSDHPSNTKREGVSLL